MVLFSLRHVVVLFCLWCSSSLVADVLQTPQPTESTVVLPDKGSSKALVNQKYGAPKDRVVPVGNPPIERWVYDKFTVYFEHQFVIHSVVHHQQATRE